MLFASPLPPNATQWTCAMLEMFPPCNRQKATIGTARDSSMPWVSFFNKMKTDVDNLPTIPDLHEAATNCRSKSTGDANSEQRKEKRHTIVIILDECVGNKWIWPFDFLPLTGCLPLAMDAGDGSAHGGGAGGALPTGRRRPSCGPPAGLPPTRAGGAKGEMGPCAGQSLAARGAEGLSPASAGPTRSRNRRHLASPPPPPTVAPSTPPSAKLPPPGRPWARSGPCPSPSGGGSGVIRRGGARFYVRRRHRSQRSSSRRSSRRRRHALDRRGWERWGGMPSPVASSATLSLESGKPRFFGVSAGPMAPRV